MHIDRWNKCQLPHPFTTWIIYQWRRGGAYWRTQIDSDRDGPCLFQIPYIIIHLSIDWSILWLIGRTKHTEVNIITTADTRTHYLTDPSTERRIPLLTDKNQGVTGTGRVYFQSETSIFTYWSINQSIDLSTYRKNVRRDTSSVQQTSGRINRLIYQQILGDPYRRTQIYGRAMSISNIRH